MGAVYRAWDTTGETEVALKVPHVSPEEDARGLERFLREGRVLAALEHPNLCRIHEVGEFEGTRYIAMEYVAGAKLSEFCGPDDPVEPGQAVATVRVLTRAMAAAHARDIVHRDLKPSNVIVDPELRLVVVDFGLALALDSESGESRLTSAGSLIGTPAYMSPEQARGDIAAMGPQCDVYAAGVILYELLIGRPPFDGPYVSLIAQILTSEPPAPSSIHEWIDPELDAICARAMAKRTDERYPSMEAFDRALTHYLGDEPDAAPIGTPSLAELSVASLGSESSRSAVRRRTRAEDSLRMRRPASSGFGDYVEQLAIWAGGVALVGTAITLFVLWLRTLD